MRFVVRLFLFVAIACGLWSVFLGLLVCGGSAPTGLRWWLPVACVAALFAALCVWFGLLDVVSWLARFAVAWNAAHCPRCRPSRAVRRERQRKGRRR